MSSYSVDVLGSELGRLLSVDLDRADRFGVRLRRGEAEGHADQVADGIKADSVVRAPSSGWESLSIGIQHQQAATVVVAESLEFGVGRLASDVERPERDRRRGRASTSAFRSRRAVRVLGRANFDRRDQRAVGVRDPSGRVRLAFFTPITAMFQRSRAPRFTCPSMYLRSRSDVSSLSSWNR